MLIFSKTRFIPKGLKGKGKKKKQKKRRKKKTKSRNGRRKEWLFKIGKTILFLVVSKLFGILFNCIMQPK